MTIHTVLQAEAYRSGAMGSLGNASQMLIRQHRFPHKFDPDMDILTGWDHDRIMEQQYDHGRRCFSKHTGTGELGFESWVKTASPDQVMAFLKDILDVDQETVWTGFRILGSVHRGNGYPVWTLQLFAKHPKSDTEVYETENAPDLIFGSRYQEHTLFGGGKPT